MTALLEDSRLELRPLVRVELTQHAKTGGESVHQHISYCCLLMVREHVLLWPICEIVYGHADKPIPLCGDRKVPSNVHSDTLHGCTHLVQL